MPVLSTTRRERFALLIASGLNHKQAALAARASVHVRPAARRHKCCESRRFVAELQSSSRSKSKAQQVIFRYFCSRAEFQRARGKPALAAPATLSRARDRTRRVHRLRVRLGRSAAVYRSVRLSSVPRIRNQSRVS